MVTLPKQINLLMTDRLYSVLVLSLLLCSSCQSQIVAKQDSNTIESKRIDRNQVPNFNYTIEVPENWTTLDTIMQDGLRVRLLLPPKLLRTDYPAGNVFVVRMGGQEIDDFTITNINYLKANMSGITILEKGNIDSSLYNGQWYTYIKEQNGIVREMINYIIPLNGFAYMITCGTNMGSMNKYRDTFDKIAKSFKG
jgi:hypothetical protein